VGAADGRCRGTPEGGRRSASSPRPAAVAPRDRGPQIGDVPSQRGLDVRSRLGNQQIEQIELGRTVRAEQAPFAIRDETKVVYTGSLQLVVEDVDAALVRASGLVRGAGGYVAASERTSDGDNPVATITYRIPAERWESVIEQLRALGQKVAGERTSAVEVTGQLVDLEARIRNLRATEAALQAILSRAERIADILEVQRELTTVRGEIEQLDAQRASLEDQATYGTLAVTYGMELVAVVEASKEWDPAGEVDRAVASLMSVLQGLATVGIWFAIVWLPILLAAAVAIAAVMLIVRRISALRATAPTGPAAS